MNHDMGDSSSIPEGYPQCARYGNGTSRFGHYVPTDAELAWCQVGNDPWVMQYRYGLYTTYFAAAITAAFILARLIKRDSALSYVFRKALAATRYVTYPKSRHAPPAGPLLVFASFAVFCAGYTFGVTAYIRPPNFGSYPIGLRPEWIATAMLPWLYTLAVKRNLLTSMTAVSYAKMQVLHQYGGWLCFILAMIHTIALTIRAQRQQPWWYTWQRNTFFPSGVGALVPLFVLCFFSLPQIRRRYYEAFFVVHFVAAAAFIGWMTDHVARHAGSQYYCYATIAVWSAAAIWRYGAVLYAIVRTRLAYKSFPQMRAELLPDRLMRLTVTGSRLYWQPGQHVFLRVLGCRPMESHPFTIYSLPPINTPGLQDTEKALAQKDEMALLVRAEDGFTARLYERIQELIADGREPVLSTIVDGPYGRIPDVGAFNDVLIVVGGTGIGFGLPVLQAVTRAMQDPLSWCKRVQLVWVAKDRAILDAFERDVRVALSDAPHHAESLVLHYTTTENEKHESDDEDTKDSRSDVSVDDFSAREGRPDIQALVSARIQSCKGRMLVAACGPDSLTRDVRKAVTRAQMDIMKERIAASEVVLHTEAFDW